MSTYLDILTVIRNSDGEIRFPVDEELESLTLSEAFLYEVFLNEEELSKYLRPEEITSIRPTWGEIELASTETFSPAKREIYLELLREVIKTNSDKLLREFLIAEGIISVELKDLARDPKEIGEIVEKMEKNGAFSGFEAPLKFKLQEECKRLKNFLAERVASGEYVVIEFLD